jgi:hypothetical protein
MSVRKARAAQGELYTHNGVSLPLKKWSKRTGIRYATLWARIHQYGLAIDVAISRPVRPHGRQDLNW